MITSLKNERVRLVRALQERRRVRQRERRFVVEGVRLCEEVARAGMRPHFVLYTATIQEDPRGSALLTVWQQAGFYDYGEHWLLVGATVFAALVGIVTFGSLAGSVLDTAVFFSLAFAGGSRLVGAPVPVWIPTLGIVAYMAAFIGVFVIALNLLGTLKGAAAAIGSSLTLRFIALSVVGFLLSYVLNFALALRGVAATAQFTLLDGLRDWVTFYACFSTAMFGAAYFFLPRLTGKEWRSAALIKVHFNATVLGVLLMVLGLAYAGWTQGRMLADPAVPFADITKALGFWFFFRSVVLGLLLIGHAAFLLNFIWIACPVNSQGTAAATFRTPPDLTLATKEGHA